jgi:hypothetical protein
MTLALSCVQAVAMEQRGMAWLAFRNNVVSCQISSSEPAADDSNLAAYAGLDTKL